MRDREKMKLWQQKLPVPWRILEVGNHIVICAGSCVAVANTDPDVDSVLQSIACGDIAQPTESQRNMMLHFQIETLKQKNNELLELLREVMLGKRLPADLPDSLFD